MPHALPSDCLGVLLLGRNRQRGRALGAVRVPAHDLTPVHALRLVGPGMLTITLQQAPWPERSSQAGEQSPHDLESAGHGPLARWGVRCGSV